MTGAQTVAQFMRQDFLLRRRRDQLDAFRFDAGPDVGLDAELGAGLDRRSVSNAGTTQRLFFQAFSLTGLKGGRSKNWRAYIGSAFPSVAWRE